MAALPDEVQLIPFKLRRGAVRAPEESRPSIGDEWTSQSREALGGSMEGVMLYG